MNKRKLVPSATFLRIKDEAAHEFYNKTEPTSRQDVADYFKEDYFSQYGYQVKFDISDLPASTYDVMVVMNISSKNIFCSNGRKFVISGVAK
jgi:hypothetical protein